MKKILISLGLVLLFPQLAIAQSNRNPCIYLNTSNNNCQPVGSSVNGIGNSPMPVGGLATAVAPTFVEGMMGGLSFDLSGNLRTAGSVSLTFPTIGAAVPATGVYNAINVAGTLRGWSGLSTGTLFPGAVAIVDASGNQITTFGGAATTSNASSGVATSSTNQANVVWNYGFNGTTWDQLQVDGSKFLKIVLPAETTKVIGTVNQGTSPWVTSATQTGTWTVQPGNTANTTAWKVDGSAVIQPISGNTGIVPITSGGLLTSSAIVTTANGVLNVKASAGQVYKIEVSNNQATVVWLKLYNSASAPTAGAGTPVRRILIPGNSSGVVFSASYEAGLAFGTGIGYALTGLIADNDTTAVTTSVIVVNIDYK